eukprot:UN31786
MTEKEPESICPWYMKYYDYRLSYKSDSDLWGPLECKQVQHILVGDFIQDRLSNDFLERRPKSVAGFISNCNPRLERNRWIEGLMKTLHINQYGPCWHNTEPDEQYKDIESHQEQKREIGKQYRFMLALENKREPDYVTEKVF